MEMTYRLRRRDQDEVGGDVNARGVDDKSIGGNAGNGGANLAQKTHCSNVVSIDVGAEKEKYNGSGPRFFVVFFWFQPPSLSNQLA